MKKKINLILDLDETIINSEKIKNIDSIEDIKNKYSKLKSHQYENYFLIFERPGLQNFLDYIFENFNVSIWTAASKDYALFIIDNIILSKKERILDYIFFDYHTIISNNINKGCTKQIEILKTLFDIKHLKIENTVILDDNINKVYNCQKNNCIVAKPFDLLNDQKSYTEDIFLEILQVQLNILFDEFVNTKDVQPYIKNINRKLNVIKNINKKLNVIKK